MTKPFSPKILIARAKTALRRGNKNFTSDSIIKIQDLTIHPGKHLREVIIKDKPIELTFTEFKAPYFLASKPVGFFKVSNN
ncbi:MAG: hypothetical protein MZU97_09080 [Bacillus subtilis]|nr:hypothetical protein [Bacillus subtilis]